MSHIFDALQRSEAKRAKSDAMLSFAATELLECAERAVYSEWEREADSAKRPVESSHDHAPAILGPNGRGQDRSEANVALVAQALDAEGMRETFSQFQPLPTSITEDSRLVSITDAECPGAEAFRLLAVRLHHHRVRSEIKSVLITSTLPGEGKSVVAANLACSLASRQRHKVLLLDGDVRRASLSQLFGIPTVPGLCNYLQGERSLIASIYHLDQPGVWLLPAGDIHREPTELIHSPLLPGLLQKLNVWFDWVVIDSPPALPFADTSVWSRLADAILFIARRGVTERRKLQKALDALDSQKLIGAVVNSSTSAVTGDYYYYRRHSENRAVS